MVAMALSVAYIAAAVAAVVVLAVRRRVRSGEQALRETGQRLTRRGAVVFLACTTGTLVGLSAIAAACQAGPVVQPVPVANLSTVTADDSVGAAVDSLPIGQGQPAHMPVTPGIPDGDRWFQQSATSSRVEIAVSDGGFRYLVDGRAQVIQGMGLNTQYASQLTAAERRARLDADFREMQALGVNTVVGWDPAEFDDVLLDVAQQHDIGVVMPFDLRPDVDYSDPAVRSELTPRGARLGAELPTLSGAADVGSG